MKPSALIHLGVASYGDWLLIPAGEGIELHRRHEPGVRLHAVSLRDAMSQIERVEADASARLAVYLDRISRSAIDAADVTLEAARACARMGEEIGNG